MNARCALAGAIVVLGSFVGSLAGSEIQVRPTSFEYFPENDDVSWSEGLQLLSSGDVVVRTAQGDGVWRRATGGGQFDLLPAGFRVQGGTIDDRGAEVFWGWAGLSEPAIVANGALDYVPLPEGYAAPGTVVGLSGRKIFLRGTSVAQSLNRPLEHDLDTGITAALPIPDDAANQNVTPTSVSGDGQLLMMVGSRRSAVFDSGEGATRYLAPEFSEYVEATDGIGDRFIGNATFDNKVAPALIQDEGVRRLDTLYSSGQGSARIGRLDPEAMVAFGSGLAQGSEWHAIAYHELRTATEPIDLDALGRQWYLSNDWILSTATDGSSLLTDEGFRLEVVGRADHRFGAGARAYVLTVDAISVPEPSSLTAFLIGASGLIIASAVRLFRRNKVVAAATCSSLALVMLLGGRNADAQAVTFQSPAYGGSVGHPFNDTHAAAPGKYHTGVDYWGPAKGSTYILAPCVGKVHAIAINGSNDHGMGNCVILQHAVVVASNGNTYPYYTLCAHLDRIANLRVGQAVSRGQVIGTMGSSGYGDPFYWGRTPHLHFEVKTAGVTKNPSGSGSYWGYTPRPAQNYGYLDPQQVIGNWRAVPIR